MRFQPGHSGKPAGRPPGSLNKATLAAEAAIAERAEEVVQNLMDRSKEGHPTAMRLCAERLIPIARNRRIAINLPVIKTPEDAEAALAVVTAELAAGRLSIGDAAALVSVIDRMVRLAERIWNFALARRYGAKRDAILLDDEETSAAGREAAATGDPQAQPAEKPAAPLYSPVNSQSARPTEEPGAGPNREDGLAPSGVPAQDPLPRAA